MGDGRTAQSVYLLANLVSACAIVFANKAVLSVINFNFTVSLTCIHTIATLLVARVLCILGVIDRKRLPAHASISLAVAFAGYVVFCNVSLALNTVGFYQLTKIAIAPTVLIMEAVGQRRLPEPRVSVCVLVVCLGIGLATVFDKQVTTNAAGLLVGCLSVLVSAQYGIWIGSMTKVHGVSSLQLLEQYLPYASLMLALCMPCEAIVMKAYTPHAPNLLTFAYTYKSVGMIAVSAILGVMVTVSTFLVIGNTSSLTYAVAGHVKTIAIMGGGVLLFGDDIATVKILGVMLALSGVVAYSLIRAREGTKK
jgi:solute carrier family 35 protein E3